MHAFDAYYPSGDGAAVRGLLESLEKAAATRFASLLSDSSQSKVRTAMKALAEFQRLTTRMLFKPARFGGDLEASRWNEWTLILFAEWMATRPSPRLGVPVQVETIIGYLSMQTHLGLVYGFALVDVNAKRLGAVLKSMRRGEIPGCRSKRRGLRGHHLRKAWKGFGKIARRGRDHQSLNNWAAVTTAWHCLARGGELHIPKRADMSFHGSGGSRYALLWLTPIKKRAGAHTEKVPIMVAEHDGGGSDCYAALRRLAEGDPQPAGAPLFTSTDRRGRRQAMTTAAFRALVKSIARGLGYDPKHFAAHSGRIGGAIDLADQNAPMLLIQAKGRWASDIAKIYCRMTRRSQLAASRLMQGSGARDCEEIFPTYTQAA